MRHKLNQRYENLQTILLNRQIFFICTAKSNLTMINLLRRHITWHNVKRNKLHTDKVRTRRDLRTEPVMIFSFTSC